jgi:hypothetical protein
MGPGGFLDLQNRCGAAPSAVPGGFDSHALPPNPSGVLRGNPVAARRDVWDHQTDPRFRTTPVLSGQNVHQVEFRSVSGSILGPPAV